jgi:hypothetical protein
MSVWDDDLELNQDPRFTKEALRAIAAKVKDAIKEQKTGPLPSWIKLGPKPKHPGATPWRR